MDRDGFNCQLCGNNGDPLCVHHWRYSGEPWESDDKDLQTLCENCHHRVEESINLLKSGFGGNLLDFMKQILQWGSQRSEKRPMVIRLSEIDTVIFTSIEYDKIDRIQEIIDGLKNKIKETGGRKNL